MAPISASATPQSRSQPDPASRSKRTSRSSHHRPRIQWRVTLLAAAGFVASAVAKGPPVPIADEGLIVDTRTPLFEDGRWLFLSEQDQAARDLKKRAPFGSPVTYSMSVPSTTMVTVTSTDTGQSSIPSPTDTTPPDSITDAPSTDSSSTTTSTAASSTVAASPLPSPLDSMSSNFTSSTCPTFLNSFLTSDTFKTCYPLSMLILQSRSFFQAEKSLVSISRALDATCAANVTFCTSYLNSLAANLTQSSNCGDDYNAGNSVVTGAYTGMIAYQALYKVGCLRDPSTSMYCFADAITNRSAPLDTYTYQLPLGINISAGAVPTCNWCLGQTMSVFQAATANRKLPIATTYEPAAQQIDLLCGPTFANQTLPNAEVASAAFSPLVPQAISWLPLVVSAAAALNWLL